MATTTNAASEDRRASPTSPEIYDEPSEPFPSLKGEPLPRETATSSTADDAARNRATSSSSTIQSRLRSASKNFQESNPPTGFMIATSQIASSVPSLSDIRRGSFGSDGWSGEGQVREKARRATLARRGSSQNSEDFGRERDTSNPASPAQHHSGQELRHQSVAETTEEDALHNLDVINSGIPLGAADAPKSPMGGMVESTTATDLQSSHNTSTSTDAASKGQSQSRTEPFDNGYEFPPKQKWTQSTKVGLIAFWKFFITPFGFLVTIYGLNVVAWGGMLFLLLCNAAPAMCHPTCNDINSPRRIWIEIDSQILNALFCVTGFGLIPWRFRDLYYLLQYRLQKKEIGLRRLAGINRGWFRLAGSQSLPVELGPGDIETGHANVPESAIPFPITTIADAPLTGIRAPPTKLWKLDFVIWTMVWNTFLQAVLSGFMLGLNRYDRPSWSTGLFVALACIVAAMGGIMAFVEGKHVKAIEGVPVTDAEKEILRRDRELGVTHYNNINDEKPKEKKEKNKAGLFKRKQAAGQVGGDAA